VNVSFEGAARSVSGSLHVIETASGRWLLDCGLFQGRREDMCLRNANVPPEPADIRGVFLSHAHVDHSGRLPRLVSQGFRGPIFATAATIDLCRILLADSAYVLRTQTAALNAKRQQRGLPLLPELYDEKDVQQTISQMMPIEWDKPFEPDYTLEVTFLPAGHILGASIIVLRECGKEGGCTLAFSGDLGRSNDWILPDPAVPCNADFVILESTYGDREHRPYAYARFELARNLRSTLAVGGIVVVPAFSVGRTQRVVYELRSLMAEGLVPDTPLYIDSPLSIEASERFKNHPHALGATAEAARDFSWLRFIPSLGSEESRALRIQPGPFIVITAAGMCEAGRVLHHLKRNLPDPHARILFVGFCAGDTLGRLLLDGEKAVRINGETISVKAAIDQCDTFSAHADRKELGAWIRSQPNARAVFLIHGEESPAFALAEHLEHHELEHAKEIVVPFPSESFELTAAGIRSIV